MSCPGVTGNQPRRAAGLLPAGPRTDAVAGPIHPSQLPLVILPSLRKTPSLLTACLLHHAQLFLQNQGAAAHEHQIGAK